MTSVTSFRRASVKLIVILEQQEKYYHYRYEHEIRAIGLVLVERHLRLLAYSRYIPIGSGNVVGLWIPASTTITTPERRKPCVVVEVPHKYLW